MAKKITLSSVSMIASPPDPDKFNAAEMGGAKRSKRGKAGRRPYDPQAAALAARQKQFGAVAPHHQDATEERKDRAVDAGGETFVDGQRIRRIADPLETLYRKGLLAPRAEGDGKDHPMNSILYQAGKTYREKWMGAGMNSVAAQDLTRDVVDGGVGHDSGSDYASDCSKKLREVAIKVGPRLLPYLNGLVVDEKSVAKMAGAVSDTRSQRLAEAIAMERVRESLHRVAEVFRLHPDTRNRAIEAWDGGATRFEARGFSGRRAQPSSHAN